MDFQKAESYDGFLLFFAALVQHFCNTSVCIIDSS